MLSPVSNFSSIILHGVNTFILHYSKPDRPTSLDWFNTCAVVLLAWSTKHFADDVASRHRYVQVTNKGLLAKKEPKNVSSAAKGNATEGGTFWSLAKAVFRNFCSFSLPPVRDVSGDLLCERHEKAKVFASNCILFSYPNPPSTLIFSGHYQTLRQRRSAKHYAPWTCANPSVWTVFYSWTLKSVPTNWSLLYVPIYVLSSDLLPFQSHGNTPTFILFPKAETTLTQQLMSNF